MSALLILAAALQSAPNCREPVTQTDMNVCEARAFEAADRALNAQWRRALASVQAADRQTSPSDPRPSGAAQLRAAQRAWLTFRDAHCVVESYEARGGSMETMLYHGCRRELTEARTAQLRRIAEGP